MDTLWIGRSRLWHPSNLAKWKVDSELCYCVWKGGSEHVTGMSSQSIAEY